MIINNLKKILKFKNNLTKKIKNKVKILINSLVKIFKKI